MSSTQADTVAVTEAPSAGAMGMMLRRAREARGESLDEVAQALKLSLKQLHALESGQHEALPGPAFVRGFLRNYARHLGLDPAEVLAGLGGAAAVDLTPLSNAAGELPAGRGPRFNLGPAAVVAGLLLLLMFAGSYLGWFETVAPPEPVTVQAFPPADADEGAGAASPALGAGAQDAAAAPGAGPVDPVAPSPVTAAEPAGVAALAPPAVPALTAEPPPVPAPEPTADAGDALRFEFSAESWVEVRDGSGRILFAGIGSAGSTRTVQGTPPFALVIGNARSVRLDYRGQPVDLVPHTKVTVARLTVQ